MDTHVLVDIDSIKIPFHTFCFYIKGFGVERGSLRALKVKNHQHGLNDDIVNKPSILMRILF